ncbi:DUF6056 family protein [Bifidobacterium sp. ESL0784]|uniref:DUF6056 family protein n=1 Tax=Bifidobacterium sp. ESL0784 TaxID=2983231 RepID=UPI0023F91451|nr:DUF6056 family protein [Bifidobacterium sp. ESL0784]MDF7640334.1 DUF6056 family protein [Bifidobacterium sp. ESL0784]
MNTLKHALERSTYRVWASILSCWVLSLLISLIVKRVDDDLHYEKALSKMNGLSWLASRYQTWSGRLFSDAMTALVIPLPQLIWCILNACFLVLLAYAMSKVAFGEATASNIVFSYAVFWLLAPRIIAESTLWLSGSAGYLWPTALAVSGCIPLTNAMRGKATKHSGIYIVCAFLASLGCEQIGPCILGFALITLVYMYTKRHKFVFSVTGILSASIIGLIIELTCPGTHVRAQHEIKHWYPGFDKMPITLKMVKGLMWEFDFFSRFLLMIIALIAFNLVVSIMCSRHGDLFASKDENEKTEKFYGIVCAAVLAMLCVVCFQTNLKLSFSLSQFVGIRTSIIQRLLPYLFWILFVVLVALLVRRYVQEKHIVLFLFLAAFCAAAIMWFSPTIYASSCRTLFVSGILLGMILCIIEQQFKNKIMYLTVVLLAIFNYMNMFAVILHSGFHLPMF